MANMHEISFWLVDVQEALFPRIFGSKRLLNNLIFLLRAISILDLPLLVTEQYPQGLGKTIPELQKLIPAQSSLFEKTTFSGYKDETIASFVRNSDKHVWVLAGIEAHICVLQTAKDLSNAGFEVIVLRDGVGSRRIEDCHCAFLELEKQMRLTTIETFLFELIEDAKSPHFNALLELAKDA